MKRRLPTVNQLAAKRAAPEKLCVFCRHWYFSGGEQGYSEMTPGSDASMDCEKRHWDSLRHGFRISDLSSAREFRALILTAETCPDYERPAK